MAGALPTDGELVLQSSELAETKPVCNNGGEAPMSAVGVDGVGVVAGSSEEGIGNWKPSLRKSAET